MAHNPFAPAPLNYLQPIQTTLSSYIGVAYSNSFPNLVLYQPGLRNGYAQNFFLGLQERLSQSVTFELNGLGSLGRRLITTDLINRPNSITAPQPGQFNPFLEYNPKLTEISYRGSQGMSDYAAMSMVVHYRRGRLLFQFAYTLSHAIDNQSDPLAGGFL